MLLIHSVKDSDDGRTGRCGLIVLQHCRFVVLRIGLSRRRLRQRECLDLVLVEVVCQVLVVSISFMFEEHN